MKLKIKYLKGKLIYLRALEKKDINRNYLSWINNIDDNYFIESSRFPNSKKSLDEFYSKNLTSKNSIIFAICNKKGKHIGNCSVSQIDWINRKCVYGRMIGDKKNSPKGAGTETLRLLQKYIFETLNLNSMWTGVSENNLKSIKSNINCGMKKVGKFPEGLFVKNKYDDVLIFAMTKKEYKRIGS